MMYDDDLLNWLFCFLIALSARQFYSEEPSMETDG